MKYLKNSIYFLSEYFFLMILKDLGISAGSINANFLILKDNSLIVLIRALSVKLYFSKFFHIYLQMKKTFNHE